MMENSNQTEKIEEVITGNDAIFSKLIIQACDCAQENVEV